MKYFFIALIISFQGIYSQNVTVKDAVTGECIELVIIYSDDLLKSALTNVKGEANISSFKGAEKISFQIIGYEDILLSYKQLDSIGFLVLMKQSSISLDEIIISASKWSEDKKDIPQKITIIRPAEIFFRNPQTAADLIGTTGQVFIQKSQLGGGSPMIRGFAANRVLIVVDGVRMNNAIFRAGNLQNVISVDPFILERAEIVFGPGSAIYGSDAIGGVMDFMTLTPKLSLNENIYFNFNTGGRYSSANDEKTGHIDFNIGLQKWGFLTSYSYSTFGNLAMGSNGPDEYKRPEYVEVKDGIDSVLTNTDPLKQVPSGYNQNSFMQKIRFIPDINWDINYIFHYSATSDFPRYDRLIEYRNNTFRFAEWYYGPQKWMMNSISIKNYLPQTFYDKLSFILAYQEFEESRHDRAFKRNILNHQLEKVNVYSLNFDLSKALSNNQNLFYGGEILINKVYSTAETENINSGKNEPIGTRYPDGSINNSYAVYLNYKNAVTNQLTFQASGRFTYITLDAEFDTTFYPFPFTEAKLNTGALTGSTGLTYRPAGDWQFNFNLATGFRAPNIDDIGKVFESEPGTVVVPNPKLKSEYAYSIEGGIIKRFGDAARLDITTFYTLLDDALIRRPFSLNGLDSILYFGEMSGVQAIQNAAKAYAWGIEGGMELKLPLGFGLSSRINFQQGEEQDEGTGFYVPLRHASPFYSVSHLTYTRERFKADLFFIYCGEISYNNLAPSEQSKTAIYARDENGNPYSPAWHTINFKAGYQVTDFLFLNAGIDNITDQRYRPYSSGITAPGRNFILSFRTRF